MAAVLPRKLSASLDHLVARVRTLRTLRALTWAGFIVPGTAFVCIVADAYFGLPMFLRVALLLGWAALSVWQVRRVWKAISAPVNVEEVASAVEMQYPRLAERLTTAVELAEHADESNGSPELIEEVIRDADVRARKLDLDAAFPRGGTVGAFVFAVALIALVITPVFMSPQAGQYLRRFFGAWYNPAPVVNYRVVVTSRNEAVKRGEPVTLTAVVEETKPGTVLPTSATLVVTANGKEERIAMTANDDNVWHARRPSVEQNFDYRVEAGLAISETKHVVVVEPVVLASAKVQINPPAYAVQAREVDPPIEGLGELVALEHSTITYQLRFHPKAMSANLQFTGEVNADKKLPESQRYPLKIADDGSTTITIPAKLSGTFTLSAEGDHRVRTEFPPQPLHVHKDEAPKFQRVVGVNDKVREVRPSERLVIECAAADDVMIDKLVLEMRLNNGPIETIPLVAPNVKAALVEGRLTLALKDKAKTGDTLTYRLAATDNCNVPEAGLKPHTSYYPERDTWAELRINPNAEPLAEQDILAKKREIATKLKDIRADLMAEARATDRLKGDTQNRVTLTPDNIDSFKTLKHEIEETSTKIENLARDTAVTPELRRLAESIRQLADREVREAENALGKARDESKLRERAADLKKANEALNEAIKKADELLEENEKAAKDRLDQLQLQDIAQQQQELAEAAKNATPKDAEELAKKQKEIEQRLKALQEQSDAIKKATEAMKATEAKRLADDAKRIADEMRNLNKAMQKNDKNDLENRLAELKKKQDELAKKTRELADKTDTATRVAQTPPLRPTDAEAAKNALDQGNLDAAAKEQEKVRQELERLARDLEKAVAESRDPREATLQLARLQEDLRQRLVQETQKTPLDQLPAEKRRALEKQQEAIARAAKQLRTPEVDQGTAVSKQVAVADTAKAREMLEKGAQAGADTKMREAKESLEKLASQLPSKEQRMAKAKDELAKLKLQQEDLRQQADQAVKNADKQDPDSDVSQRELAKKLADATKRQAELADKMNKLDTPGQDARRDKTAEAMQKAAADMNAGRPQDIAAAQQGVKREMERLEQALNGQTPADDKVAELAKKQQALAEAAAKNAQAPDKGTQVDLAKRQGDIVRELDKLQTPEAAAAQAEAAEAAKKAENAGRDTTKPDELAKKAKEAADKLDKLNERVNGRENAAETADRLAKKQKENAADQEKRKDNASTGEARKKAAQEAEELKNLRTGADAQKVKQQAQEALQRAQNTLDPTANAQAQRDAAAALEKLAEQLTREDKAQTQRDPQEAADAAERLGKKQRDLAEALQKANDTAKQQGGDAGKQAMKEAMQKAAQGQRDLAKQAEQIPGRDAPKEAQQAQEAMRKAQEELERENFEGAQKQQKEAADALERLSREAKEKQQQRANEAMPNGPNQQMANEARQLAEEQRKLRDEAMKAADELAKENNPPKENPVEELAKQQQQVAQQAAELAKTVGERQGEKAEQTKQARQAADSAKQTSNQVRNGELNDAKESGKQAAQAMEQMAQANPGTDSGKKAQDLARQQGDINKKLEELTGNNAAARGQQQARQQQLETQARDVGKRLEELAQQAGMANGKGSDAGEKAKEAAGNAQQAGNKMHDARQASQKGQREQAGQSRDQAANAMERASQQAGDAAKQLAGGEKSGSPQAGDALQKAQGNMQRANQQLGQKQPGEASGAMEKAAQQLQQASNQLQQGQQGGQNQQGQPNPGEPGSPTNPGGNAGAPGGKLDLRQFSPDVAQHSGKAWGDLPGEIQTKIIQEMKARYGEDYARNIQLYFKQLAERK